MYTIYVGMPIIRDQRHKDTNTFLSCANLVETYQNHWEWLENGWQYPTYVLQPGAFLTGASFSTESPREIKTMNCFNVLVVSQRPFWTGVAYI